MIAASLLACALLALLPSCFVSAHSWVACTDYRGDVSYYDDDACFAYPRGWERSRSLVGALAPKPKGYQMAIDSGYHYDGAESCPMPQPASVGSGYTTKHPQAIYEAGSVYCLAWPTKNHVATAACGPHANLPETKFAVHLSSINPAANPTQAEFDQRPLANNFGTHSLMRSDCLGFGRSPRYCEDTDKALASGCFLIPATTAPGRYTLQWYWSFVPSANLIYKSCWDATVVPTGQGRGSGRLTGTQALVDNLSARGEFCDARCIGS